MLTAGLQWTPLLASGAVRDASSPKASALEDLNIWVKEPFGFSEKQGARAMSQRAFQVSCGQETHADSWTIWCVQEHASPGKRALRQDEFWAVRLSDTQVFLIQMECGASTFPWGDKGQVFIWSFYAFSVLTGVFWDELCLPLHLARDHFKNSKLLELFVMTSYGLCLAWESLPLRPPLSIHSTTLCSVNASSFSHSLWNFLSS